MWTLCPKEESQLILWNDTEEWYAVLLRLSLSLSLSRPGASLCVRFRADDRHHLMENHVSSQNRKDWWWQRRMERPKKRKRALAGLDCRSWCVACFAVCVQQLCFWQFWSACHVFYHWMTYLSFSTFVKWFCRYADGFAFGSCLWFDETEVVGQMVLLLEQSQNVCNVRSVCPSTLIRRMVFRVRVTLHRFLRVSPVLFSIKFHLEQEKENDGSRTDQHTNATCVARQSVHKTDSISRGEKMTRLPKRNAFPKLFA